MKFQLGCAKADITPKIPVFMRGYSARNCLSNGIEEPLEAGALVLQQGRTKLLILTIDNIGLERNSVLKLCADIEKATGFAEKDTYLCCSHTHFAPSISEYYVLRPDGTIPIGVYPPEPEYYPMFLSRIVNAINEAKANVEPVEVEETAIQLNELLFNRRTIERATGYVTTNYVYPIPPADEKYTFLPVDPELMVWRFRAKNGIKAILGRFSCHPVTGGKNSYAVSADYPGYFQKFVKEYFACPGFFMLGNAGDAVPMQRNGESRKDIGQTMANAIRLAERRFRKVPEFKLEHTVIEVPVKLRVKCRHDQVDKLWEEELAKTRKSGKYRPELEEFHYKRIIAKAYPNYDLTLPLQLLRLGSKVLVGTPYEVLTEIGTKLRAACPETVLTTLTGGAEGYLPLAKHYARGGYEANTGSRFNKRAGDDFLAAAIKAVKAFNAPENK